jgi:hypothetical protein
MKRLHVLALLLAIVVLASSATLLVQYTQSSNDPPQVYVGVAFGGTTVEQAKLLIDRTKTYTNLFILDCGINAISVNQSAVEEICDYATSAGLNIIVNLGTGTTENWQWQLQFLNQSKDRYGDKFLGAYYDDETCGIPFDYNWTAYWSEYNSGRNATFPRARLAPIYEKLQTANTTGTQPQDYTLEAQWYNQLIGGNPVRTILNNNNITTYTSDYLLWWYDYLAGYDTLFAQVGWNMSLNLEIAQIRGAATLQNKDWGAIITWKYDQPPYLDNGDAIYNQMVTAYNAGAKYIALFDYPYNVTGNNLGAMTDQHFEALERFWNQILTKTPPTSPHAQAALVLPKDYGFGMRRVDDKIWGFWSPDSLSQPIWNTSQRLLDQYGLGLDIVYDDPAYPLRSNYSQVYFWNQTMG